MIKIKEQTIKELESLSPEDLIHMYDLIVSFKSTRLLTKIHQSNAEYLKVREALKNCKGSLSEDIISDREDRI